MIFENESDEHSRELFEHACRKENAHPAFNLPSKFVLYTVGPIIFLSVGERDKILLSNCYSPFILKRRKVPDGKAPITLAEAYFLDLRRP